MSKKNQSKNTSSQDNEVFEVQKIINQRISDGKKQYKVIWKGYAFQQATWQPEENLKCPEKISQFLRRYQDVIKRKNLLGKSAVSNEHVMSVPQKPRVVEQSKVRVDKVQPQTIQKIPSGQVAILNKEKLHASMQKSSIQQTVKKTPDIESLKSKIMTPQTSQVSKQAQQPKIILGKQQATSSHQVIPTLKDFKQIQDSPTPANAAKISIPQRKPQQTKVIKITPQSIQKTQTTIGKPLTEIQLKKQHHQTVEQRSKRQQSETMRRPELSQNRFNEFSEERKISSQRSESESNSEQGQYQILGQQMFLSVGERMDIETIFGVVDFGSDFGENVNKNEEYNFDYAPTFFLVKNRFSDKEKIVEKQRIIDEEPLKLIDFYERLLVEGLETY